MMTRRTVGVGIPALIIPLLLSGCGGSGGGGDDTGAQAEPEAAVQAGSDLSDWELENGIGPITEPMTLGEIDPARVTMGEEIFTLKCSACHKLEDGANAVGPTLYQVVNRPVQSVSSFAGYSGALSEAADVWSPDNLNAFLTNPKGFAPGNKMSFAGFKKAEERANIIAFLENPEGKIGPDPCI